MCLRDLLDLRNRRTGRLQSWAPASVIVVIAVLVAAGCKENGEPTPSPAAVSRAATSTPAGSAVCASVSPSSPTEDTIFDTLQADASTLGDFDPGFATHVSEDKAGAPSELTFAVDSREGDVQHLAFYITIPSDWPITPGCAIPLGVAIGSLSWKATLGILNNPCNTVIPIEFEMQNASTDPSDTIDLLDGAGNLVENFEKDNDGSGLADVIEKYPVQLKDLFPGRTPGRRSVGIASVARMPVIAQSLLFPPPKGSQGQTLVILFQDFANIRTTVPNSPISDQCTPFSLSMTNFAKTDGGAVLIRTPPAGTYTFALTAFGLRDADDDGLENALDTCPFDMNVGDPRVTGSGDADQDGLDAACDPNDLVFDLDEDGDKHQNRGDLCALTPSTDSSGAQKDSDTDQIGDECDIFGNGPDAPDGPLPFASEAADVIIQ